MGLDRAYAANNFALEIDGAKGGIVTNCGGGLASAEVISEQMGVTSHVPKHLGQLTYSDITFKCGAAMSKDYFEWIKAAFDAKYVRKNGAIIHANFNYEEVARCTFLNALPKSIGFPALDATSKEACQIDMTVGIESRTFQTTKAGSISGKYPTFNDKQKRWTCANYRPKLDGHDEVCQAVTKIDAVTFKLNTAINSVGEHRGIQIEPSSVELSDLVITFYAHKADAAVAWWDSFVQKGVCDESAEKTGSLEFLTTDLSATMFTLNFHNLGCYKLEMDQSQTTSDDLKKMKLTMYNEKVELKYDQKFVGG